MRSQVFGIMLFTVWFIEFLRLWSIDQQTIYGTRHLLWCRNSVADSRLYFNVIEPLGYNNGPSGVPVVHVNLSMFYVANSADTAP